MQQRRWRRRLKLCRSSVNFVHRIFIGIRHHFRLYRDCLARWNCGVYLYCFAHAIHDNNDYYYDNNNDNSDNDNHDNHDNNDYYYDNNNNNHDNDDDVGTNYYCCNDINNRCTDNNRAGNNACSTSGNNDSSTRSNGIYFGGATSDCTIHDNFFHEAAEIAVNGIYFGGATSDCTIHDNFFHEFDIVNVIIHHGSRAGCPVG